MPATREDVDAVYDLVDDATRMLDWCAGPEATLEDENGERISVLPGQLIDAYRAAVDQAQTEHFALALRTLRGDNADFPFSSVLAILELAAWTGALRIFKLRVLEHSGREEVMEVARRGRAGGGSIRGRIFRAFLGPLDAALDSLEGIPGVAAIKELKDFLGGAQGG